MGKRLEGNGDSSGKIHVSVKKPGYVVFVPDSLNSLPEDYSIHLSLIFEQWQQENPGNRIRHVLPIVKDGQTVVLHVYYDLA